MAEHTPPRSAPPQDDNDDAMIAVQTVQVPNALFEGAVFLGTALFGVWFVAGSFGMRESASAFGPGTFPFITGMALIVVSLAQLWLTVRPRESRPTVDLERPVAVALAAVMILIFPTAIDRLGYFAVAAVWTPLFAILAGLRTPLSVIGVTAAVLGLAWFGFVNLLGTPLP